MAQLELLRIRPQSDAAAQRARLLALRSPPVLAVLEGGLARPHLIGGMRAEGPTVRQVQFLVEEARRGAIASDTPGPPVQLTRTKGATGSLAPARALTARAGQTVLFLITILLSGMLLSQLIDEKANKIIEVLAAAVPIDAIFLGKLFDIGR